MDVQGKRVIVMGLGNFSGGVSAAQFMAARGARVIVTDLAGTDKLSESLAAIVDLPIEAFRLGGHRESDFSEADLVIASPAVREDNPFLQIARAHGATITTEMNLFFQLCPAEIIGVTGSNGKSTTAAMIHSMLQTAFGSCWLGGNIGHSLLHCVDEIRPGDTVVLELSSFQLEDLGDLKRSPNTAVVTTFTPNHLDRHSSLESYRKAKQTVLQYQQPNDLAILNADDPEVKTWPTCGQVHFYGLGDHGKDGTFWDGDHIVIRREGNHSRVKVMDVMRLPGIHNQSNAAGAICCASALGADCESIRRALCDFKALPHRLEFIGERNGRSFYDDSIATTPESTLAALEALSHPIWLIAGGYDKGLDLNSVAERIAHRVEGLALIGQTAGTIQQLVKKRQTLKRVRDCTSMEEAVAWCFDNSKPGDAILLSPACASFGMFQNFVERGRVFRQAVHGLALPLNQAG